MSVETEGETPTIQRLRRSFVTVTSENERLLGYLTILPVLVLFTLSAVLPIVWAVAASFNEVPVFRPEWVFIGLQNYTEVLSSGTLHYSLFISLAYAIGTTVLELVLGVAIALLINRKMKGISIIRMVVLSPYLLPTVVVGILFQFMGAQFGVFNDILLKLGIFENPEPFFTQMPFAFIGVVFASVWKFTLFVVLMTLARLQSIPNNYYEAAKISGAGPWRQFWDITFPQLKGIILIVLLLRGVWMFNKFDIIWILTRGGPNDALNTLPVFAYETAFIQFRLGVASAISVIGFVLLTIVAIVYFRVFSPAEEVAAR
ncbi:carbohydrate ABC transporter permease [Haloarchaeobius sp. HRN-SO-5]|uniref:carbohydrate ABC transporter permease n=1 Tax=Haloarchaeobius sp. HRN-SO-5 TaxID=3446118 RepID=UPI003EBDC47C